MLFLPFEWKQGPAVRDWLSMGIPNKAFCVWKLHGPNSKSNNKRLFAGIMSWKFLCRISIMFVATTLHHSTHPAKGSNIRTTCWDRPPPLLVVKPAMVVFLYNAVCWEECEGNETILAEGQSRHLFLLHRRTQSVGIESRLRNLILDCFYQSPYALPLLRIAKLWWST